MPVQTKSTSTEVTHELGQAIARQKLHNASIDSSTTDVINDLDSVVHEDIGKTTRQLIMSMTVKDVQRSKYEAQTWPSIVKASMTSLPPSSDLCKA